MDSVVPKIVEFKVVQTLRWDEVWAAVKGALEGRMQDLRASLLAKRIICNVLYIDKWREAETDPYRYYGFVLEVGPEVAIKGEDGPQRSYSISFKLVDWSETSEEKEGHFGVMCLLRSREEGYGSEELSAYVGSIAELLQIIAGFDFNPIVRSMLDDSDTDDLALTVDGMVVIEGEDSPLVGEVLAIVSGLFESHHDITGFRLRRDCGDGKSEVIVKHTPGIMPVMSPESLAEWLKLAKNMGVPSLEVRRDPVPLGQPETQPLWFDLGVQFSRLLSGLTAEGLSKGQVENLTEVTGLGQGDIFDLLRHAESVLIDNEARMHPRL